MSSRLDIMSDELQWPRQFPGEAQSGELIKIMRLEQKYCCKLGSDSSSSSAVWTALSTVSDASNTVRQVFEIKY